MSELNFPVSFAKLPFEYDELTFILCVSAILLVGIYAPNTKILIKSDRSAFQCVV